MPLAIRIHAHGGPEVLRLESVERAPLGRGQVRIRQTAIGVNYIDTYDRNGIYPDSLPTGLGREAAGNRFQTRRSRPLPLPEASPFCSPSV